MSKVYDIGLLRYRDKQGPIQLFKMGGHIVNKIWYSTERNVVSKGRTFLKKK